MSHPWNNALSTIKSIIKLDQTRSIVNKSQDDIYRVDISPRSVRRNRISSEVFNHDRYLMMISILSLQQQLAVISHRLLIHP